ncbi:MAG TPA: FecR domain-containing protein [Burkholderiales bacterium]|nr:FecR domain-containing protein [Burkholderiales bacterium]
MSLDRSAEVPVAPEIADQAVRWLVELQAGADSDSMRHAWERWRQENPEHERAWQQIESVNRRLKDLPGALSISVLAGARKGRRRSLKLLVALAVGGGAAWTAKDANLVREWMADYGTKVGERRTIDLADGTEVVMNTDTALDVKFDGTNRVVRLIRGEIMVTTAPDRQSPARPFLVDTEQGRMRALGTRFSVRLGEAGSGVAVFEGAVELRPADNPAATLVVPAGRQATLIRDGYRDLAALDESSDAWTKGMIVASNMPLGVFLAELSRHRPGRVVCAPEVARLRVSGTYPLSDTDRVFAAIERNLPIKVERFTRYWVSVKPRQPS